MRHARGAAAPGGRRLGRLANFALHQQRNVASDLSGCSRENGELCSKPRETVVVMLTKDELFVQGERVASIAEVQASPDLIIAPLREALLRHRIIGKAMAEREIAEREVTVMADKSLPYEVLRKLMTTCSAASYGKLSLAVLEKEAPASAAIAVAAPA